MISDSHMHSNFSSDSDTPMEQMAERAIALGMESICITDHYDKDYFNGEFQLDTDAYQRKVRELQNRYGDRIEIRFGVELGLQRHLKDWMEAYVNQYPFDFVIGSMHLLEGKDPYYKEAFAGRDEKVLLREYFQETAGNLDSFQGFQSLGHLDYLVRYLGSDAEAYTYQEYADEIDEILKRLIRFDIALEVNTAGYRYGRACPNPGADVLGRYRELGGEMITIGADGHFPQYVGYGFERAEALLTSCGFRYYTLFRQKKPHFIKI